MTAILLTRIGSELEIDTDLAALSPQNQHSPDTKAAIDKLSSSIQQRIVLMLSGDEDAVLDAHDRLIEQLLEVQLLEVLPDSDELAEQLIEELKAYRFSLLSESQRATLIHQTTEQIVAEAKKQLYQLSGQTRVYSFADDPLGWHSATLFELLGSSGFANPESRSSGTQTDDARVFTRLVNLKISRGALNIDAQSELTQLLDKSIADVTRELSVSVDRSGVFFFAAHAAKSSKQDISLISTGSSIGVVLLLLFAFRSFKALALPFVSVALGVGFAVAVTHTLFGKVHVLTIVFGASLIGIVIDYSLHFFYHRRYYGRTENRALHRALSLSLLTSLIGYAALSFSSLAALQKVALFSCCGLVMAWLTVVCWGDYSIRQQPDLDAKESLFGKLAQFITRLIALVSPKQWIALTAIVVISAVLISTLSKPFNDDPRVFFTAPQALLNSERKVAEVANDYEPGRYIIVSGTSEDQLYSRHQQLFEQIKAAPSLDSDYFTSLLNWIPDRERQDQDYALQSKLYNPGGAAQQLLGELGSENTAKHFKYYQHAERQRLTPNIVSQILGSNMPPFWVDSGDKLVNFVLIKKGVNADSLTHLVNKISGVEYVNTLERTRNALSEQRESAGRLLLLAYLLVALVLLVRFKTRSALWLVVVPICSSSTLIVLSMVFGFQLNLFHVMALFLVLGFGMDYTIFAHEMQSQSNVTLQAILLSALTSLLSFGLLALSSIPVVASFGITLLIGNSFNLLGAFVYSQSVQRRDDFIGA